MSKHLSPINHFAGLLLLTLLTLSLCGCSSGKTAYESHETITVTDMLGENHEITKNPSKVACISRTTYDLLVAYGLGDRIDGAYSGTLNNEWVNVIYPNSSSHYVYSYENSYELFIERGVDLVFAPEKYIADDLNNHGIPALCVSLYGNPTFDEYVTFFSNLVTQIWDDPEVSKRAHKWESDVKTAITEIQNELSKHPHEERILFYIRGDKDKGVGYTDTKSSFTEYAYRMLGFNFAGAMLTTTKPSAEEIIKLNPYAFVAGGIYQNRNMDILKNTEPYNNLDAVKNDRVYSIPIGFTAFEQLSVMTPIFFYDQANKLYPEYFSYDIHQMAKDSIKEYFGIELSDEQIDYMLQGLSPNGGDLIK